MSWLFSKALVDAFGASNSSPEAAGESLADTSSEKKSSAQLNVMPSPQPFWRNDKTMDVLSRSPFGQTWQRLTDAHGEAVLKSFLEAFPVRTFQLPGREPESTARKADFGAKWPASLAKYDHSSSVWKTHQHSLFGGLEEFSGTWPRWGMMRDGELFPLPTPSGLNAFRAMIDRHLTTSGNASGSLQRAPTPKASQSGPDFAKMDGRDNREIGAGLSLQTWCAMTTPQRAPTPRSEDSQCSGGHRGVPDTLTAFVRLPTPNTMPDAPNNSTNRGKNWGGRRPRNKTQCLREAAEMTECKRSPTPSANDWKGSAKDGQRRGQITDPAMGIIPAGGQLNPQWEDWLMGWPIGWTDARHSATDKFRQWSASHGISSEAL